MKISLILGTILLTGCSINPSRNIANISVKNFPNNYLDPKFETYWNGSYESELNHIQEVGSVISNFVKSSALTKKNWYTDFQELKKRSASELSSTEKNKLIAYKNIFNDLPEREIDAFATRDVHRKDHGCYKAEVKILDQLDSKFSKGLFRPGEKYDALIRYSNGNPNNNLDIAPDARGMAVKFLPTGTLTNTSIEQLNPEEINRQGLLDILTINFPTFFVDDPLIYAKINSYFLNNQDDVLASKKLNEVLSVFNGGMSNLEKLLALRVNGSIIANPLYQEWFSMAPSRLGEASDLTRTAVKYMIEPCKKIETKEWPKWSSWQTGRDYQTPGVTTYNIPAADRLAMTSDKYYLRNKIKNTLSKNNFCYSLYLQPYNSAKETPIENSTKIWHWDETERQDWLSGIPATLFKEERAESLNRKIVPRIKIGQITLYKTNISKPGLKSCEDLSFNPWNNVPDAHKPLGITQRVKRAAYHASRSVRFYANKINESVKD